MAINLRNFEQEIDGVVVKRGKEYWRDGLVRDLEEIEEGKWNALVEGNEVYEVSIQSGKDNLKNYFCTCPYDLGPVCKHVVAVLYALTKSGLPAGKLKSNKGKAKRKPTVAEKVEQALRNMSVNELIDFIREQALGDRQMRAELMARTVSPESPESRSAYRQIVKESLHAGMDRHEFIDYWGSGKAMRGVDDLIVKANQMVEKNKVAEAIPIYEVITEELVDAINGADDSNGDISGGIETAIEQLHICETKLTDINQRLQLFDYLLDEAQDKRHKGWHWKWNLLDIAADIVADKPSREQLFKVLESISKKQETGQKYIDSWDAEKALEIKLQIMEKQDGSKEVQEFMEQYATYPNIRTKLLEKAFVKKDYQQVKILAEQGIKQDKERLGLVIDWQEWLYKIARIEKDANTIRAMSRTLFMESGKWEYFNDFKKSFSTDEWPEERHKLVAALKKDSNRVDMHEFYIREELWEELLSSIKRYPSLQTLQAYHKHLVSRFPGDLYGMYEKEIRKTLGYPSGRATYQEVCRVLREMKKLGNPEKVDELVLEFSEKYKNRPSLRQELLKV
ncbi:MAG: SWIM zinc finger family protein [Candidatus Doudnabacteria bacterium]|nr:SWIM zinc finger family protein [Candidatus Doudnabacteria bacterium]